MISLPFSDVLTEKRKRGRDEAVSLRGFYLRLLKRWYVLPAAAAAGALAGLIIYVCAHFVFGPPAEYAAGARLYIEFAPDAAGNARDLYNAWTWKDLITSDDILDTAMKSLCEKGLADEAELSADALRSDGTAVKKENDELVLVSGTSPAITRADVLEAVTIRMPSDLRLMMLTATSADASRADDILAAMRDAIVHYGDINDTFYDIRVLETTPALKVVDEDLTKNAVIFGGVLGLVLGILLLFLIYASDDAVYDPETCETRYKEPVLGVIAGKNPELKGRAAELADELKRELVTACGRGLSDSCRVAVLAADDENGGSERLAKLLGDILGPAFRSGECSFVPVKGADELSAAEGYDAAVIGIKYARKGSTYADHVMSAVRRQDIPVAGTVLYDADIRYLRMLYGLGK